MHSPQLNPQPDLDRTTGTPHTEPAAGPSSRDAYDEERLVRVGLPLVDAVAKRLWLRFGRRHELDELAAMGRAALVPLLRAYDPARAPLVPYLVARLDWAVRDAVRAHTHARAGAVWRGAGTAAASRRSEARSRAGCGAWARAGCSSRTPAGEGRTTASVGSALGPPWPWASGTCAEASLDAGADPERDLQRRRRRERLHAAVQELPRRERLLVIGHYFHERRFDRVAEELGISKSWASRLHRRALRRLHRRLHGVAPVAEPPPVGDGTSACPSRRDLRAPAS